MMFIGNLKTK